MAPVEETNNLHSKRYRALQITELCKVKFFAIAVAVHVVSIQVCFLDATSICRCVTWLQIANI
jgi:hypothetical protein